MKNQSVKKPKRARIIKKLEPKLVYSSYKNFLEYKDNINKIQNDC